MKTKKRINERHAELATVPPESMARARVARPQARTFARARSSAEPASPVKMPKEASFARRAGGGLPIRAGR